MYSVTRYDDISCGHRVVGHEGGCKYLHGHNYRIHFTCKFGGMGSSLDGVGRVIDFGVIKTSLCGWIRDNWDHKMLIWKQDPDYEIFRTFFPQSVIFTSFNPTAENMAYHLVEVVGPQQLKDTDSLIVLTKVVIEETRKCSAEYEIGQ